MAALEPQVSTKSLQLRKEDGHAKLSCIVYYIQSRTSSYLTQSMVGDHYLH